MSRTLRIVLMAGIACFAALATLSVRGVLAFPGLQITIGPTKTPTPPISSVPTRTPTPGPSATPFPSRTPRPTDTPPATPTPLPAAPNPTAPAPGIATVPPPPPPVAVASATKTPLSVTVPSPEPTDLPVGVPAATSTPPSFTAGEVPDLVSTAIEVTQGVQNLANDMPLVEGRLTVARVYVKTQDPDVPAANVKGVLVAFRDGQYLGVEYPENGPITAVPDGGLRTNLDDSLYFYLPGAWTTGAVTLRAFVYSTTPEAPYDQEPDAMNNVAEAEVDFQDGDPLKLRLAPLHLHVGSNAANSQNTYYYEDHESDALAIILDLLRLHPLATDDLAWDASSTLVLEDAVGPVDIAVTSIAPVGHQDGVEWDLSSADDRGLANERIAFFKSMAPEEYQGWRWYGMVDPSVSMGGYIGWASNGGTHGLMNNTTATSVWNNMGGYALAHEIAHLFLSKPEHVNCSGGESGPDPAYPYPAPNCQIAAIDPDGYYAFDTYWALWGLPGPTVISNDPGAAANQFAFPMMGAKKPWWIDPFYYCRLLDEYGVPCDPLALNITRQVDDAPALASSGSGSIVPSSGGGPLDVATQRTRQAIGDGYIYVSARVDADAGAGAFIDVMRMPDAAPSAVDESRSALAESAPSDYALSFEDAAGSVLASFALSAPEPAAHGAPAGGPAFAGIVPYPAATAFLRLRGAGRVLAERAVSSNAPVVRLLSPNGGDDVTVRMDVRWEAFDTDGDPLTFTVMYSRDDGASWTPLATGLRGDAITLPSLAGVAGSDRSRIRVLASDGMRTSSDDSDAAFRVPNSPPRPSIVGPADGAAFPEGATVMLQAAAYDAEDGSLSGDSLRWRSSLDGDLGAGRDLRTRGLRPGTHTIELVATDSAGAAATRTTNIAITAARTGQPDQAERDHATDLLLNGPEDDGGPPWLIIIAGAGLAAAAIVLLAAATLRKMGRRA